jgi:hypothetical protein
VAAVAVLQELNDAINKKHDGHGALRLDERQGSHGARYGMGEGMAHHGMGVDAMVRHESSSELRGQHDWGPWAL